MTHFIYPFIHHWMFGYFHFGTIANSTAINRGIQKFLEFPAFSFLDICLDVELLD